MGVAASSGWLIDAHTHLHEVFDADAFFVGAAAHFAAAARQLRLRGSAQGCLLLVELAAQSRFRALRDRGLETRGGWRIQRTGDALSVVAEHQDGTQVVVVAGRQIATDDGLEVLAVGCEEHPRDGQPIERTLELVSRSGALPIIPWGFGKWWFRRGRLVERLVRSPPVPTLFLGDSGGRWRRGPTPRLLRIAEAQKVWNLPGSDPLPLSWQASRAGSYGFLLPCDPDREQPATQIEALLRLASAQPAVFGSREGLVRFMRAQIGIRVRR